MQILYYEDGTILAVGNITYNAGVYHVTNDKDDINEYSLSEFGEDVFLSEVETFPEKFCKLCYKFIDNGFVSHIISNE